MFRKFIFVGALAASTALIATPAEARCHHHHGYHWCDGYGYSPYAIGHPMYANGYRAYGYHPYAYRYHPYGYGYRAYRYYPYGYSGSRHWHDHDWDDDDQGEDHDGD